MKTAFAILSIGLGALMSFVGFALIILGSANSKDEDQRMLRIMMTSFGGGGFLFLIAGIWLLVAGYPWIAAIVGGLPVAMFVILIIWMSTL